MPTDIDREIDGPPTGLDIPGLEYKPGATSCGRGVEQAREVLAELAAAGIPSVVVGVRALMYYGAKRVTTNWEICVPDDLYEKAAGLFDSDPLNKKYDPWPNFQPQLGTLGHTYRRYTLKGVRFWFFLTPEFENKASCHPDDFERSARGIPYPKLDKFAQSLLITQRFHDLENLVDGMDLTEEWGVANLDFSRAAVAEYAKEKNKRIAANIPDGDNRRVMYVGVAKVHDRWLKMVRNKEKRIGVELPKEKYETRFRIRGSGDPRLRVNRQV